MSVKITVEQPVDNTAHRDVDEETIEMLRQRRANIDPEKLEDRETVMRELRASLRKPRL